MLLKDRNVNRSNAFKFQTETETLFVGFVFLFLGEIDMSHHNVNCFRMLMFLSDTD